MNIMLPTKVVGHISLRTAPKVFGLVPLASSHLEDSSLHGVENTMSMRIVKNGSVLLRRPPSKVYISSSAAIMSGTKR
jgi:hypothetical protein